MYQWLGPFPGLFLAFEKKMLKKNAIFYNIWLVLYMIDELFVLKIKRFIEDVWHKNSTPADKNWKLLYTCFEL